MCYISRLVHKGLIGSLILLVAGSATLAHSQGRMTIQATAKGPVPNSVEWSMSTFTSRHIPRPTINKR